MPRRRSCAGVLLALLITLPSPGVGASDDGIVLTARSYQDTYVLHEPVQLTGELANNSDRAIRIYGIEKFSDENMPCLFMEIVTPDGRTQERRTHFYCVNLARSESYMGEPLKPGERRGFDIYPNHAYSIYDFAVDGGWTFPSPGDYRVRLVYEVEAFRKNLWKPPGNRLYSNQITIRVIEPSPAQKEILSAYWKGSNRGMRWDAKLMYGLNEAELHGMLQKYPAEPFIKYIHFALMHVALGQEHPDPTSAGMHARYLMSRAPDFRPGLVRWTYADVLIACGRKDEGIELMQEALEVEPRLVDNFDFMESKITAETGDSRAIWLWKKSRMELPVETEKDSKKE